jgi:hypothetical protein
VKKKTLLSVAGALTIPLEEWTCGMRDRAIIGWALTALTVAAVSLLVAGCGPAAQAEDAVLISPGAVREMQALGIRHSEGLSPSVAYTATFRVKGPAVGIWMDSLGKVEQIHFDGEITEHLEGTVYRLPWEEAEDGSLLIDEVLTHTVKSSRPHRYLGQWHLDEEPRGFELSIVSLDGGQSVGFLFPRALYGESLDDLPDGVNHWYWQVFYGERPASNEVMAPTPTGIPPEYGN